MFLRIIATYVIMVILGFLIVIGTSTMLGAGPFMGLPPQFAVFMVLFNSIPFTLAWLLMLKRKK